MSPSKEIVKFISMYHEIRLTLETCKLDLKAYPTAAPTEDTLS